MPTEPKSSARGPQTQPSSVDTPGSPILRQPIRGEFHLNSRLAHPHVARVQRRRRESSQSVSSTRLFRSTDPRATKSAPPPLGECLTASSSSVSACFCGFIRSSSLSPSLGRTALLRGIACGIAPTPDVAHANLQPGTRLKPQSLQQTPFLPLDFSSAPSASDSGPYGQIRSRSQRAVSGVGRSRGSVSAEGLL